MWRARYRILRLFIFGGDALLYTEEGRMPWEPKALPLEILDESIRMKKILDVCCGGRTFRRDKNNPLAEYMDIRREEAWFIQARPNFCVDPDFVADFRNIPRDDNSYKLVVFDPPHLKNAGEKSRLRGKYGKLNKDTWTDDLRQGFRECMRVLEPYGTLVFKRNECQVKLHEVLRAIDYTPLFGTRSWRNGTTIRLVFMKI